MHDVPRVGRAAKAAILIGCPLLSAVTLAPVVFGIAALIGAHHVVTIGLIAAGAVFVVNTAALCMALTRGEADAQSRASVVVDADAVGHALAS